jgi:ADP-heptose:LPS heptosyltransferase
MAVDLKNYADYPRTSVTAAAHARYARNNQGPQAEVNRKTALVLVGTGVGNIIEQTPLITAVSTLYQDVDVFLPLSTEEAASVIHGMPGVRRMYIYKAGLAKLRVRKEKYSAIFATYLVCDFTKRIRHDVVYISGHFKTRHFSERDLCMQAAIQAGYAGVTSPVWCARERWPHDLQGVPLIGITGGSVHTYPSSLKRYPHYVQVVEQILREHPNAKFVNIGTLSDDEIDHPSVVDMRGLTTIAQAADVAASCDVYIANDCGMAHVAAAMGTPTVVVFGPTRIVKNLPIGAVAIHRDNLRCRPCQYSKPGYGKRPWNGKKCKQECMTNLPTLKVSAALLEEIRNAGF